MSILNDNLNKPINAKNLRASGFIKQGWGRIDDRSKRRFLDKWNKSHHFWEYVSSKHDPKGTYTVVIWYFPEEFDGYVTPFNYYGKQPAGSVYITLDSKITSNWNEIMKVDDMLDIDTAIGVAVAKINEFNKR